MAPPVAQSVDTVIVGNGPSALILSFILHGNIPIYNTSSPHPDPLLHQKLKNSIDLLHLDVDALTEHFSASRFSYSTQALPINVLLDTLLRPHGETDETENRSCVVWKRIPEKAVSHVVVGNTDRPGGQWVDNPVKASWEIGTLSYAAMLSLPAYSFEDYYRKIRGEPLPHYLRPSRRIVADYLAAYPSEVGIDDTIYCGQRLSGITRSSDGFFIASHNLWCRNLVLASGIFSELIPPRALLQPLLQLPAPTADLLSPEPVLVIGSGFSAADVIISSHPMQKIIHIYKWAPTTSPSPLKACHQQAYPEYARMYKRMKIAALSNTTAKQRKPSFRRAPSSADGQRDWASSYEGLPNTVVIDVQVGGGIANVKLQCKDGEILHRRISSLAYVVGRRGSMNYLDSDLRKEVLPEASDATMMLSGRSLREKANESLEVARNVFIVGSLTGDSLIRFAYGGCAFAAGRITNTLERPDEKTLINVRCSSSASQSPHVGAMHGLDGHECPILAGAGI